MSDHRYHLEGKMDENSNFAPEEPMVPGDLSEESDSGFGAMPEPPVPPTPAYTEPPAPPAPPVPPVAPQPSYAPPTAPPSASTMSSEKSKVAAGVLAILLGSLGVHKFYLGYMKEGIILVAVTFVSFGMLAWATSIVGIVEGIIYLTKTDQDFYATYVAGRKAWF